MSINIRRTGVQLRPMQSRKPKPYKSVRAGRDRGPFLVNAYVAAVVQNSFTDCHEKAPRVVDQCCVVVALASTQAFR